jgi:hypothetical protein
MARPRMPSFTSKLISVNFDKTENSNVNFEQNNPQNQFVNNTQSNKIGTGDDFEAFGLPQPNSGFGNTQDNFGWNKSNQQGFSQPFDLGFGNLPQQPPQANQWLMQDKNVPQQFQPQPNIPPVQQNWSQPQQTWNTQTQNQGWNNPPQQQNWGQQHSINQQSVFQNPGQMQQRQFAQPQPNIQGQQNYANYFQQQHPQNQLPQQQGPQTPHGYSGPKAAPPPVDDDDFLSF